VKWGLLNEVLLGYDQQTVHMVMETLFYTVNCTVYIAEFEMRDEDD
jgi:hypothetical protein